jgi:hypothetical protein
MSLASWRDLMIVLAGAGITLATLVLTILIVTIAIILFKRVKRILAVTDATIGHVDEVAKMVKDEIVKPVASIAAMVRGITDFVNSFKQGLGRGQSGGPPAAC